MSLTPDKQASHLGDRVLVINVARIGDTLLGTPLLRSIKHHSPACHLTCIAHPNRGAVLKHLDFIDQLCFFTKNSSFMRFRGQKRWDTAFVLGHDLALLKFALRTSHRVIAFRQGVESIDSKLFLAVDKPEKPTHAVKERLMLAKAAGIEPNDFSLAYSVTNQEHESATEWLHKNTPQEAKPIIGLQMSSFPTKAYRDWPIEHFIALAKGVLSAYPNAFFIPLGDEAARIRALQLASEIPGHATVEACGRLDLRASAALMQHLDLYVGVDTGPTHLAGALGIPMVALYHCVHPGKLLAPLAPKLEISVIEHPQLDTHCERTAQMSQITVDRVLSATLQRLATNHSLARPECS